MDTEGQELGPYEAVLDVLVLAAIERAIRHGAEDAWIAGVGEHLGYQGTGHTTRRLRQHSNGCGSGTAGRRAKNGAAASIGG
jgi:hypothetical protein